MSTPIIMCGAAGRMGHAILRCAAEDAAFRVVGAVEAAGHAVVGKPVGALIGLPEPAMLVTDSLDALSAADKPVAIHFSSPDSTIAQLHWSVRNGLPVVIGTTGLNHEQRIQVEASARQIPIVFAPNMSIGVNVLFKLVGDLTRILGDAYDVEITEMHHRFKKDAPSGTARHLGDVVAAALGGTYEELVVDGRSGIVGERPARQIGMHALRGGDVVGDHTVTFATQGERIEVTHRAHSRDTFARGALRAAAWVVGKPAGLYDMQDVLGLK